jgi:hypothetical protein
MLCLYVRDKPEKVKNGGVGDIIMQSTRSKLPSNVGSRPATRESQRTLYDLGSGKMSAFESETIASFSAQWQIQQSFVSAVIPERRRGQGMVRTGR